MTKKSFAGDPTIQPEDSPNGDAADNSVDSTALSQVEDMLPATSEAPLTLSLGKVSGPTDARDLVIPRLNIVQGVGPLSEIYTPGDIVYNKEVLLVPKDEPITLTVLSIKKDYVERLPYDPQGPRPREFSTLEEVADAGYWVDWRDNQPPPVKERAEILILIQKPGEIDSNAFNMDYEGTLHTLAVWTVMGTAYTRAAKRIFSAVQIELSQTGLMSGLWELSATREQIGGNFVFVPTLRSIGKNPVEKISWITESLS